MGFLYNHFFNNHRHQKHSDYITTYNNRIIRFGNKEKKHNKSPSRSIAYCVDALVEQMAVSMSIMKQVKKSQSVTKVSIVKQVKVKVKKAISEKLEDNLGMVIVAATLLLVLLFGLVMVFSQIFGCYLLNSRKRPIRGNTANISKTGAPRFFLPQIRNQGSKTIKNQLSPWMEENMTQYLFAGYVRFVF